jgi:exodeoxyribonuclease V gamma subunit
MEGVGQNTWQAGLDRVLTGVSMSEQELRWLGLALPLDDVDSNDVDLAGRVAELVDRVQVALDRMQGRQTLEEWSAALDFALVTLTSVHDADAWQLTQARRELAAVIAAADERAGSVLLALADVRSVLADRLRGRPTRVGFRTGDLTVCSMVPMRSVPHRVVCLLGLDDGIFPRTPGVDGDDVLARDPLVGERDRRSEDRQLLLDAVLAAQEHLVLLYTGADERTNTPRPPAVPLGEILDVVDATLRTRDGKPARERVVVRHPLQPFDARNFAPGPVKSDGPFSFDISALAGARASAQVRRQPEPFLPHPLPVVTRTSSSSSR